MTKKILHISVAVVLCVIALNALWAGYGFMADPSGTWIGMNTYYLVHSPFHNFFLPGLILFVANGILNIITVSAGFTKSRNYPFMVFIQGSVLVDWIVIQVAMVRDFNALHVTCLALGIYILVAGMMLIKNKYPANP